MRRRFQGGLGCVATVICILVVSASGQDKSTAQDRAAERQRFDAVPTILGPIVAAVGPRLNTKGKERTDFVGQYLDESGRHFPVQMVQQLPNQVRLDGFGSSSPTLRFDGSRTTLLKSATEDALLETLASDTCEGMLAAVQKGAALRLLGRFFKPDPKENPNYKGEGYDVYEVTAPVPAVANAPFRVKFYWFDSISGLLASTRYTDSSAGRGKDIEVRFSNWQKVEGSSYPGQIDRYENNRLAFSIAWTSVSNGAQVDAQTFSEVLTTK